MVQQFSARSPLNRWTWGLVGLAIVGTGASGLYWFRQMNPRVEPESTVITLTRTTITALGRLEPQGETVQVNASTATQENRIAELRVEQGDRIEAGEIIAVLAARDRLTAALTQAESDVQVAQAQLAQVQAGAKPGEVQAQEAEIDRIQADRQAQIRAQQTAIASRQAEVQNARTELERYRFLHNNGAVSTSERDSKQLTLTTAEQSLANAQAELSRLQTTQAPELNRARATLTQIATVRPVDVQVAQAEVQRAIAAQAKAKADLDQVYVRSPQSGVVLDIYSRAGEVVSSDGIVEIGGTAQMVAIAEVYQSDIQGIQLGQTATVTSTALSQDLNGTVERIGAKVQRQDVVNTDPSSNIDARVVEVEVMLDPDASAIASTFTNLQVQVEIAQ